MIRMKNIEKMDWKRFCLRALFRMGWEAPTDCCTGLLLSRTGALLERDASVNAVQLTKEQIAGFKEVFSLFDEGAFITGDCVCTANFLPIRAEPKDIVSFGAHFAFIGGCFAFLF